MKAKDIVNNLLETDAESSDYIDPERYVRELPSDEENYAYVRNRDLSWYNREPAAVKAKIAKLKDADRLARIAELKRQQAIEKVQREIKAANDPEMHPSVLRALVGSPEEEVMLAAAQNKGTPIDAVLANIARLKGHRLPRHVRVASGQNETARMKRLAREHLGAHNGMPVRIVLGSSKPPRIVGRSYYWTTPSGKTEVTYPNAYGWPTVYHGSTQRIVVGSGWFNDSTIHTP